MLKLKKRLKLLVLNKLIYSIILLLSLIKPITATEAYKTWIIDNFDYGEQIYNAYTIISNLEYVPEFEQDLWQTPNMTFRFNSGDCEDANLLFYVILEDVPIKGSLCFGWVTPKNSNKGYAHVWYEIYNKDNKCFIVEPFSNNEQGIIREENLLKTEERLITICFNHCYIKDIKAISESYPSKHPIHYICTKLDNILHNKTE